MKGVQGERGAKGVKGRRGPPVRHFTERKTVERMSKSKNQYQDSVMFTHAFKD